MFLGLGLLAFPDDITSETFISSEAMSWQHTPMVHGLQLWVHGVQMFEWYAGLFWISFLLVMKQNFIATKSYSEVQNRFTFASIQFTMASSCSRATEGEEVMGRPLELAAMVVVPSASVEMLEQVVLGLRQVQTFFNKSRLLIFRFVL